jgi:hypothetical protein
MATEGGLQVKLVQICRDWLEIVLKTDMQEKKGLKFDLVMKGQGKSHQ